MYKFTEEEREFLRKEEGFSEELIDSLQYIDEDESESFWRGSDDKQAMMESLMRDDDPVDQAKVYKVLDDTLRVNATGEISNVMFRGADAYGACTAVSIKHKLSALEPGIVHGH